MKKLMSILLLAIIFISCNKEGCTDPVAYNYNADAKTDDGSCAFEGCTDTNAVNYDANATLSSNCLYDHIGLWTLNAQTLNGGYTITDLATGNIIEDTTYNFTVTDTADLNFRAIRFIENGDLFVYYNNLNVVSDTLLWVISNNDFLLIETTFNGSLDTTFFTLSPIESMFMRFEANDSGIDTISNGSQLDTYSITEGFELIRN